MSGWRPPGPQGNPHAGQGFSGRKRQTSNGGPNGVQRSSAAQLKEQEPLFTSYEHLAGLPRGDAALVMLRRVASVVKPIMRKRNWRVQVLAEFLPPESNLLGLNINRGYKICIRLRYHNNPDLFLPFEEVVDTMLHELSHNVWGEHDSNFHKLWDELRDEHEVLLRKGYTGEGFHGSGQKLGGMAGQRTLTPHEMRQRARASAEKRKATGQLMQGSGQKLGGTPLHLQQGRDVRQVIADQVTRRNAINRGCASGRKDADNLSQQASNNTFKTKAEEDDANNRAIAQALFELMEQEEEQKLNGTYKAKSGDGGLAWSPENGLYNSGMSVPTSNGQQSHPSEEEQLKWAMEESTRSSTPDVTAKPILPPTTSPSSERTKSAPPVPINSKPPTPAEITSTKRKQIESNLSPKPPRAAPPKSEPPSSTKPEPIDLDAEEPSTSSSIPPSTNHNSSTQPLPSNQWTCQICTCINPMQFLACDACGIERPHAVNLQAAQQPNPPPRATKSAPPRKPTAKDLSARGKFEVKPADPNASMGWNCGRCGAFMEHKWWTCSACGEMKASS